MKIKIPELDSCPFCGKDSAKIAVYTEFITGSPTLKAFVCCKKCRARGSVIYLKPTLDEHMQPSAYGKLKIQEMAANAWNKR